MTATTALTEAQRRRMVRFTRPERWPMLDRFPISDELHDRILAEIVLDTSDEVRQRIWELRTDRNAAAAVLLADPSYRESLRRLPFHGGDRVAALGDSLTADRLGWFELLAETMRLAGRPGVATHNLGLSGDTTADAVERFDLLEAFRPTHVLVLLGTNDARRHGRGSDHRMVSPAENRRNLAVLRDLVEHGLGARAVFVTPPPADQGRIDVEFAGESIRWDAADLDDVAAAVREVCPDPVDVHRALSDRSPGEYLDDDGVHLSPHGQRLVAAVVARALADG